MVGNFPQGIYVVHVQSEWTEFQSSAYLELYSHQQNRVSECTFAGYRWGNWNAMLAQTDAWTRQWRKAERRSNHYYERPECEATFLTTLEQRA